MKKIIKWIVLGVVAVVVLAVAIIWININGIVRSTVQSQAAASLDLPTRVGGATISLFGGSFKLSDFQVGSPPDFKAPNMLTLGEAGVQVSLGQLRQNPIHIAAINLDAPHVVIEASGTKLNFQALMDRQSKTPTEPKNDKPTEPVKVIIDELTVNNAQVALRPGLSIAGLKEEYAVNVPSITLKNVGNADGSNNGVAIKEVVVQVLTALASEASKSKDLPGDLQNLLNLNVDAVKQQLQAEIGKKIGDVTKGLQKNLPGDLGKNLDQKAVEKGLGDLLGNKKDKKKKSNGATTNE